MKKRTEDQWLEICDRITAGYSPGKDKRNVYLSRQCLVDRLKRWAQIDQHTRLLDLGCGNGRLPMGLVDKYPDLQYLGIDVIKPVIDFCKMAFTPWYTYDFIHWNTRNGHYWSRGKDDPAVGLLPVLGQSQDVVFCNSLFTHAGQPEVAFHWMQEVKRVIKPDGIFIATWIIGDYSDYDETKTVYKQFQVDMLYAGFEIIGMQGCPDDHRQTEIAAKVI